MEEEEYGAMCLACARTYNTQAIYFDGHGVCEFCLDRARKDKDYATHLDVLREQHPVCPGCGAVMSPTCLGCGGRPVCDGCDFIIPCSCTDYEV